MKNYYDYGCGKGENHFYPRYEENHEQSAFNRDYDRSDESVKCNSYERNDYYNYSFDKNSHANDDRKEQFEQSNFCQPCARVYSMKKHDCSCEHNHRDERERCKHNNCYEHMDCDCKRHAEQNFCNKRDNCYEHSNNGFCFGFYIPPFPFRCRKHE